MLVDILPKIAASQYAEKSEPLYHPRPSSAGPERCIRSLVYHASGVPKARLAGRAVMVFDDSSWHEELTADWIRKSAFKFHSQQMAVELAGCFPWLAGTSTYCGICKKDRPSDSLHGHIDGIITDLLAIDRVIEHKAINHFTFERYWKGEWPLDYLTQLGIYLRGIQKVQPDIHEGILLIKNKNTSGYIEFLVRYGRIDDSLLIYEVGRSDGQVQYPQFMFSNVTGDAINKFVSVEYYRKKIELPPRPFEAGTEFPCGYCPWTVTCWEGYEKEFEDLEKDADLGDLAVEAGYYRQLGGEEAEIRKKREELRGKILATLSQKRATAGRAGEYLIEAKLLTRKTLDKDLIPPYVLANAQKESSSITLYVKKLQGDYHVKDGR